MLQAFFIGMSLVTVNTGSPILAFNLAEQLHKLQMPASSDAALATMQQSLSDDPDLRAKVAVALPKLMTQATDYSVLGNDSRLAGQLKVVACIPLLRSLYLRGDIDGRQAVTLTKMTRLENDPAGHALVEIGDPAIESLKGLLLSQDDEIRRKAVMVLANMGSPASMAVLREHRPNETDEYLQRVIDRTPVKKQVAD